MVNLELDAGILGGGRAAMPTRETIAAHDKEFEPKRGVPRATRGLLGNARLGALGGGLSFHHQEECTDDVKPASVPPCVRIVREPGKGRNHLSLPRLAPEAHPDLLQVLVEHRLGDVALTRRT